MAEDLVGGVSRRTMLVGAAGLCASSAVSVPKPQVPTDEHLRLWYQQPAARWEEALPVGNGRFGAMVFGRVAQERLQLNEDTFWSGSPYDPNSPDAFAALPEVRALIAQGRYKEASALASAKVMARPLTQMSYSTLGDLLLDFDTPEQPRDYVRMLDLEQAITRTSYRTSRGSLQREVFASAPDQVILLQLQTSEGERLSFTLGYRGPRKAHYTSPAYQGSATPLTRDEAVDWLMREEKGPAGEEKIVIDGANALLITGHNEGAANIPGGLTYALKLKLISDGQVEVSDGSFRVKGARTATLIIAAATSYRNYTDTSGDPVGIVRGRIDRAASRSYAVMKQDHIRNYAALFGSLSIDLGRTAAADMPTDRRIATVGKQPDPALAVLYVQYARYLLISSSRPGTQPANLQGIWNEGTNPPWGSKYTININTEMNYWPAGPAGLTALGEPLLRMVEDLSVTGARTAQVMYGARGWVAHHNTDLWRATAPIDGPEWGLWPCGGAWLCNTLWDQYQYSQDASLLRRLYPLMKGAALFFLDTLIEDPKGRGLVTSPSVSPENQHPFGSAVCAGPAMDRQIIRDLFAHVVEAGTLLGKDTALLAQVKATRARIAPDRIGKSGQLQEWLEDWDEAAPEQHHRHVSHLYAVYPSSQINVRDTPDLIEAAKTSLRRRGDLATGWGTAWRLCLWARMGEAEHAYALLQSLTGPERTYPNMFDAHPPFQIDGNFGGAAGIMEMLVQSWGGELILLPALPSAWPDGSVKGIHARGGLMVDIAWRGGKLTSLMVKGPKGAAAHIRYGGKLRKVKLDAKGFYRLKA